MHSRRKRSRYLITPTITPTPPLPPPNMSFSQRVAKTTTTRTTTTTTTTSSSSSANGSTSSTTHACAACKHQRRKCESSCLLRPYFPHDRQNQFMNAHKLFGVSNISRIIKDLNPTEKDEAMRTIIYQSDARARDPVLGCYRIIRDLHRQIEYCQAELEIVLRQLDFFRAQAQAQAQAQAHQEVAMRQVMDPAAVAMVGGCEIANGGDLFGAEYGYVQPANGVGQEVEGYTDSSGQNGNAQPTTLHDFSAWVMQDSTFPSDFDINKQVFENGCDDMKPLLDMPGDERSHDLNLQSEVNEKSDHDAVILLEDNKIGQTREEDEIDTSQEVLDHDLKVLDE